MGQAWSQRNTYYLVIHIFIKGIRREADKITDIVTPTRWRLEEATVIAVMVR